MPSRSKQQQKFMGMAHALKKGEMKPSDASPELKKVAKSMSDKDVKDFASTSHKGLPRKVKQEILHKLKEYANKMGRDHLGGDSIPSAKKGGLRDFDGYDNVDYNKDMPMDEVSSSDAYKISRMLGTAQQSTQDFIEDNKIDVKKLESYIKKLSPSKKIIIKDIINGSTDKRLSTIKKGLVKQIRENIDEAVDKDDLKNAKKRLKDPHTIEDIEYSKTRSGDKFVKIIYKKKYVPGKMMDTGPHFVSVFYNDEKDLQNIGKTLKVKLKESLDEACWKGYKEVGGKIKNGKQVPNCVPVSESMMSTLDQMKKDSKNIRDFIKKVLSDKDFRDMKGDKDFIKYLGSMYEGVTEGGIPQNWMQGRTSDYHTKLRGKDREYDDTNFDKENSGQEDLEESTDSLEYLKLLNKAFSTMPGSPKQKAIIKKLNVIRKSSGEKPLKESIVNEAGYSLSDLIGQVKTFDKPKTQKLLTIMVINKLKEKRNNSKSKSNKVKIQKLIDKIEGDYKKGKFIKEYGQRLDLSYLEDEEARLDGTPKPKDAIDRDLDEQTLNELGVFPIRAFLQDLIPSSIMKTTTPKDKERLQSTIKDLIITLNRFWKQHNIPYRVREK